MSYMTIGVHFLNEQNVWFNQYSYQKKKGQIQDPDPKNLFNPAKTTRTGTCTVYCIMQVYRMDPKPEN